MKVSPINPRAECAILECAYPLGTFSMSDQTKHLFSCEETFEACAVRIVISDNYWNALLPDNRLGAGENFCKQLVLIGDFNMDVSTSELWMAPGLNQIVMTSDLVMHRINGLEFDKAIHCLGGWTFHDYVDSAAHGVVDNNVGTSTKEVLNLIFCDIVWNLQNE